jgi:hypothetical protein
MFIMLLESEAGYTFAQVAVKKTGRKINILHDVMTVRR